jgi:hypothetical protein
LKNEATDFIENKGSRCGKLRNEATDGASLVDTGPACHVAIHPRVGNEMAIQGPPKQSQAPQRGAFCLDPLAEEVSTCRVILTEQSEYYIENKGSRQKKQTGNKAKSKESG